MSPTIVICGIIAKILFGNEGLFESPQGDKRFGVLSQNNWMPHMPSGEGITYALFAAGASAVSGWLFWEMSEYGKHVMQTNEVVGQNIMINAQFPVFALAVISPDPAGVRPALPGVPPCGPVLLLRRHGRLRGGGR